MSEQIDYIKTKIKRRTVKSVLSALISSNGGGGGGTWGSITGTLSSQTDLQAALDLKSNLASPTFTGTPAAPTAAQGTNTTQLATTAFVMAEIDIVKNLNQIGGMGLM